MKGGNLQRAKVKPFLLTLLTVICMAIFLWFYEKKPIASTLLSWQDQFVLPTSDAFQVASHISEDLVKPKDPHDEEKEEKPEGLVKPKDPQEPPNLNEEKVDKPQVLVKPKDPQEPPHSHEETEDEPQETEDKPKPYMPNAVNTDSVANASIETDKAVKDSASSFEKKECNYAKGRWVVDSKRPLYSGFKCKHWLSEMWACRLTQRPDFGYEAYRWQPENCNMPEFERSAFLKRMQHKTIAFVGDSLGRQQFQSLMCMVTGGEDRRDVRDVGREYGLVTRHGAARPDGWAFRFVDTNTTILYYWSSCLCDLESLDTTKVAMHLDRPPSFLKRFLHVFDVLVLNTGHHWNRGKVNANRWVMHVDGKPNQDKKLAPIGNAKSFTIYTITRWLDSRLQSQPRLKAFFRTTSPRHFFNGEWNTGGSCENTTPLARGSEVKGDESSDRVVGGAVRGTKVKLLDITAMSQLRDEGHISRYSVKATQGIQDCLHWCLPGIPDTWNEILAAQI